MKYINNNRIFLFSISLIVIACWSCKKDTGTYDVRPINEISIGMDSLYYISKGEHVLIKPTIVYSKDESADTSNYTYEWFNVNNSGSGLIATGRDLDFSDGILKTIILPTGIYNLYYRITDKKTGVFSDKYFKVKIGTLIYEGWLALCEPQPGKGRLDMVSNGTGTDVVYQDVLQKIGSDYSLTGSPRFVTYIGNYYLNLDAQGITAKNGICLGTSTGAVFLDQDSLKFYPPTLFTGSNDFTDRIASQGLQAPATWADAVYFDQSNVRNIFYANNKLYRTDGNSPGAILSTFNGTPFSPSPWVAMGMNSATNAFNFIFFNRDTKTFLMNSQADVNIRELPAQTLFNYKIDMDLQYMDFVPYKDGLVYAILKNGTTGKRYMVSFTIAGVQVSYAELMAEGLSDDSQIAISPVQGYLLYTVGNKVYEYDPLLKQSFLMHDYGDRKISLFKYQKFRDDAANLKSYNVLADKLIVATYAAGDPSASGNIDLFTVPDVNSKLEIYKSYTGLGKIVSLTYMQK